MMRINKAQRVGVFVDVQNMYYSAKFMYKAKVDFSQILRTAVQGRSLIRAIAYVIKTDIGEEKGFFDALENIGFEVKMKDLQVFYGGNKKGDWDIGIAMDIVRLSSKVDNIVLVSGDGDFKELLQYVKAQGCRAEVMAFGSSSSKQLVEEADAVYDLSQDPKRFLIPKKRLAKKLTPRK